MSINILSRMFVITAIAALVTPASVTAVEIESSLARGGRLYDSWYGVIDVKAPKKSHALYPAGKTFAKDAESNWRCKECHGWDYKGKDGAYAIGAHYTGIKGINGMIGANTGKIIAVLKSKKHGYGNKLSATDMQDLANFVSKGQVDMRKYVDYASGKPIGGNQKQGSAYFNTVCAKCHRKDGTKPKDMGQTLGKQQTEDPLEVVHKILNGHPGEKMPSLRAFDKQIVLDIVAHLRTLPTTKHKRVTW